MLGWLGLEGSDRDEASAMMKEKPLSFMEEHLDMLPPHQLQSLAKVLSPESRGRVARIRARRRKWAQDARPEELGVEEARKRDPLLYKNALSSVHRKVEPPVQAGATASRDDGTRPFSNPSPLVEPDRVEEQRRFASVVERLEEEEIMITLRRQQGRPAEVADEEQEEEYEDESDDDRDTDRSREDDFREEVLERYVRGDVSCLCGSSLTLCHLIVSSLSSHHFLQICTCVTLTIDGTHNLRGLTRNTAKKGGLKTTMSDCSIHAATVVSSNFSPDSRA